MAPHRRPTFQGAAGGTDSVRSWRSRGEVGSELGEGESTRRPRICCQGKATHREGDKACWNLGGGWEQEGPCPWQPQRSDGPGVSRTGSEGGREKPGGPWGTAPCTLHPCRAQEGRYPVARDLRLPGVRGACSDGAGEKGQEARGEGTVQKQRRGAHCLRGREGRGGRGSSGEPAPAGAAVRGQLSDRARGGARESVGWTRRGWLKQGGREVIGAQEGEGREAGGGSPRLPGGASD